MATPTEKGKGIDVNRDDTADDPSPVNFCHLPAEIQEAVWTACLPHRVVELCPQAGHRGNAIRNYSSPRLRLNKQRAAEPSHPPVAAGVCYESRVVAERSGCWKIGAAGIPVWFDAERDTVLLNGERVVDYMLMPDLGDEPASGSEQGRSGRQNGQSIPEPSDSDQYADGRRPTTSDESTSDKSASTSEETKIEEPKILTRPPVNLAWHQLLSCLWQAKGGVAVSGDVLRSHLGRSVFPLLEHFASAGPGEKQLAGPLLVYFDDVCITGTREEAVESGLFGLFLEERMFFVPLDDFESFRRLRKLNETNKQRGNGLRVGNSGFIRSLLASSHVAQNQRLLEEYYLRYRNIAVGMFGANRARADAAIREMPKFQHVVMFRYCESKDEGPGPWKEVLVHKIGKKW